MFDPTSPLLLALLVLPVPPGAPPQGPAAGGTRSRPASAPAARPRTVSVGRVTGRDGEPWAGARILCVSQLFPEAPQIRAFEDRVEARSDARGRFRVRLLEGRFYTVFALAGDGAPRASAFLEDLSAGAPIMLREARLARPRVLRLEGLEAWRREFGPLRLRIVPDCAVRLPLPVEVGSGGRCRLPPLPPGELALEIWDGRGRPLFRRALGVVPRKKTGERRSEEYVLRLPPFSDLRVEVKSFAEKKPVPEVRILHVVGRKYFTQSVAERSPFVLTREVGRTDAAGRCTVRLPWQAAKRRRTVQELLAVAEGWAVGRGRTIPLNLFGSSKQYLFRQAAGAGRTARLVIFLQPAPVVSARLVGEDGRPLARTRLFLVGKGSFEREPNSYSGIELPWLPLTTGPAGRLRFTLTSKDSACALLLPAARGTAPDAPLYHVVLLDVAAGKAGEIAAGDLRLRPSKRLALRVVGPDGLPARGADVLLRAADPRVGRVWDLPLGFHAVTNRRGEVRLDLPPAGFDLCAVRPGAGYALQRLDLREHTDPVELRLAPLCRLTARCTDAHGAPLAGVRCRVRGWSATGRPEFQSLISRLNGRLLQGVSDAQGRVEVWWIPSPQIQYRLSFEYSPNGGPARAQNLQIGSESILDYELRF